MRFNVDDVQLNVIRADTLDLLDRVTAYRKGMDPRAIILIEEELRRRNVSEADIRAHADQVWREAIKLEDGTAARCSFCNRPAVERRWGWHWYSGFLPIYPRQYDYCNEHRSAS